MSCPSRLPRIVAWSLVAAIVFVTVCPIGWRPPTQTSDDLDRALAFLLLGAAFAVAYPRSGLRLVVLLPLAALGTEALQFLSATRDPHLADAAVKALGALGGTLAGKAVVAFLLRRRGGAGAVPAIGARSRR